MSDGGVGGDGASVSGKIFAFVILPENSGEHGGGADCGNIRVRPGLASGDGSGRQQTLSPPERATAMEQPGLVTQPCTPERGLRTALEPWPPLEEALLTPGPRPSDNGICLEQLPGDKYNKVY